MNTNQVKKDGFSNPDTERLYEEWCKKELFAEVEEEGCCGMCAWGLFLDPPALDWVLCTRREGPHPFETVGCFYRCRAFKAEESDSTGLIFDPPPFPKESLN